MSSEQHLPSFLARQAAKKPGGPLAEFTKNVGAKSAATESAWSEISPMENTIITDGHDAWDGAPRIEPQAGAVSSAEPGTSIFGALQNPQVNIPAANDGIAPLLATMNLLQVVGNDLGTQPQAQTYPQLSQAYPVQSAPPPVIAQKPAVAQTPPPVQAKPAEPAVSTEKASAPQAASAEEKAAAPAGLREKIDGALAQHEGTSEVQAAKDVQKLIDELEETQKKTEKKQGIFGKAVNWFKNLCHTENSSKKVNEDLSTLKEDGKALQKAAEAGNTEQFNELYQKLTGQKFGEASGNDIGGELKEKGIDRVNDYKASQDKFGNMTIVLTAGAAAMAIVLAVGGAPFSGGLSLAAIPGALALMGAAGAVGGGLAFAETALEGATGGEVDAARFKENIIGGAIGGAVGVASSGVGGLAGRAIAGRLGSSVAGEAGEVAAAGTANAASKLGSKLVKIQVGNGNQVVTSTGNALLIKTGSATVAGAVQGSGTSAIHTAIHGGSVGDVLKAGVVGGVVGGGLGGGLSVLGSGVTRALDGKTIPFSGGKPITALREGRTFHMDTAGNLRPGPHPKFRSPAQASSLADDEKAALKVLEEQMASAKKGVKGFSNEDLKKYVDFKIRSGESMSAGEVQNLIKAVSKSFQGTERDNLIKALKEKLTLIEQEGIPHVQYTPGRGVTSRIVGRIKARGEKAEGGDGAKRRWFSRSRKEEEQNTSAADYDYSKWLNLLPELVPRRYRGFARRTVNTLQKNPDFNRQVNHVVRSILGSVPKDDASFVLKSILKERGFNDADIEVLLQAGMAKYNPSAPMKSFEEAWSQAKTSEGHELHEVLKNHNIKEILYDAKSRLEAGVKAPKSSDSTGAPAKTEVESPAPSESKPAEGKTETTPSTSESTPSASESKPDAGQPKAEASNNSSGKTESKPEAQAGDPPTSQQKAEAQKTAGSEAPKASDGQAKPSEKSESENASADIADTERPSVFKRARNKIHEEWNRWKTTEGDGLVDRGKKFWNERQGKTRSTENSAAENGQSAGANTNTNNTVATPPQAQTSPEQIVLPRPQPRPSFEELPMTPDEAEMIARMAFKDVSNLDALITEAKKYFNPANHDAETLINKILEQVKKNGHIGTPGNAIKKADLKRMFKEAEEDYLNLPLSQEEKELFTKAIAEGMPDKIDDLLKQFEQSEVNGMTRQDVERILGNLQPRSLADEEVASVLENLLGNLPDGIKIINLEKIIEKAKVDFRFKQQIGENTSFRLELKERILSEGIFRKNASLYEVSKQELDDWFENGIINHLVSKYAEAAESRLLGTSGFTQAGRPQPRPAFEYVPMTLAEAKIIARRAFKDVENLDALIAEAEKGFNPANHDVAKLLDKIMEQVKENGHIGTPGQPVKEADLKAMLTKAQDEYLNLPLTPTEKELIAKELFTDFSGKPEHILRRIERLKAPDLLKNARKAAERLQPGSMTDEEMEIVLLGVLNDLPDGIKLLSPEKIIETARLNANASHSSLKGEVIALLESGAKGNFRKADGSPYYPSKEELSKWFEEGITKHQALKYAEYLKARISKSTDNPAPGNVPAQGGTGSKPTSNPSPTAPGGRTDGTSAPPAESGNSPATPPEAAAAEAPKPATENGNVGETRGRTSIHGQSHQSVTQANQSADNHKGHPPAGVVAGDASSQRSASQAPRGVQPVIINPYSIAGVSGGINMPDSASPWNFGAASYAYNLGLQDEPRFEPLGVDLDIDNRVNGIDLSPNF
jgi:hypothetical protein